MSEAYILNLFDDLRGQLLDAATGLSSDQMTMIPHGFRNHVHWQLGHVWTITDQLVFGFSGLGSSMPSDYNIYFASGTSPADWTGEAPAIDEVRRKLVEQQAAIREAFIGKLSLPVADRNNFLAASTVCDLFHVLIAHEAMHLGMLTAMVKSLTVDRS